jgi:hypothetical protein
MGIGDMLGGLGRTNVLALLREMTQDGFVRVWAVPCPVEVGKPIKGVKVACLDGIKPCLLDWKDRACMVEANKSTYARKIKALGIKGSLGGRG